MLITRTAYCYNPNETFFALGIPSSDSKNANLYFLDVVHQANTIFHLFDKQFNDHLMPLIRYLYFD